MCRYKIIFENIKKRNDHGMSATELELAEAQAYDAENGEQRLNRLEELAQEQNSKFDKIIAAQERIFDTLNNTVAKAHKYDFMTDVFTSKLFATFCIIVTVAIALGGSDFVDRIMPTGDNRIVPFQNTDSKDKQNNSQSRNH